MKLLECIEEIRRKKNWEKQEFAAAIGIDKTVMSKLGVRWDEHWNAFLRILNLCDEIGIDPRKSAQAEKAQPAMTAKEVEERMAQLLYRLLQQEKPRPKKEFIEIVQRAYDRAKKRKDPDGVPRGPIDDKGPPRTNSAR